MKNSTDLRNIKHVRQTDHVQVANALLETGWILLTVSVANSAEDYSVIYVLGWDKDIDPINIPAG